MVRGSGEVGPAWADSGGVAATLVGPDPAPDMGDAGADTTVTVPAAPWPAGVKVRCEDAEVWISVTAGDEPDGVKIRVGVPRTVVLVAEPAGAEPEGVRVRFGVPARGEAGPSRTFVCTRSSWVLRSGMVSGLAH